MIRKEVKFIVFDDEYQAVCSAMLIAFEVVHHIATAGAITIHGLTRGARELGFDSEGAASLATELARLNAAIDFGYWPSEAAWMNGKLDNLDQLEEE